MFNIANRRDRRCSFPLGVADPLSKYRGRSVERLLWSRPVLWHSVLPGTMVLLVVVRDPEGIQRDDYFFTTDLAMAPADVVHQYAGRWSIEETFRNTKQFLGGEHPQTWVG